MEHKLRPPGDSRSGAELATTGQAKLWLVLATVVGILLIVLLVLPTMVSTPELDQPSVIIDTAEAPVVAEPITEAAVEKLRSDAQQALQSFLRLQAQPGLSNAEAWAGDDWQAAFQTAANGDKEFGQERFAAALKIYTGATAKLQAILDGREQTLSQSLASGWQFLQLDEIADASTAFELVLAMEPDHQEAQLGLERASVRTPVLQFMLSGQQAEITANLQSATVAYSAALELDMLYTPAQEALNRVTLELEELAFQDAMGRALQSLHNGKFSQAEQALHEAAQIYPDDKAIKDARQRLQVARQQSGLSKLRKAAEQLARQEDWSAAAEKYKRALKIDSQAAFARNGLARAEEKAQLHQQLDHYLADVTRLYSPDPLNNATSLLTANQQASKDELKLLFKLKRLQQAVNLASTPVELLIISDNLTKVTVYKVGQLGSFMQKQLSLRPGKYTITGSRQGYRDVLKTFDLEPAAGGQVVNIRSEEKF